MPPTGTASPFTVDEVVSDADLEEWLQVRNAVDVWALSAATLAARGAADARRLRLLGRIDGRPVAAGSAAWDAIAGGIGEALIRIWILAGSRGLGIGTAMYDRLAAFAAAGGMTRAVTRVIADDQRSLEFAFRHGFEVKGMQQPGILELDGSPGPDPNPPDGVMLVSLAERPDLERAAYAVEAAAMPDVPSWGDAPVPDFEVWRATNEELAHLRELSILAIDAGQVVGSIQMFDDGDGSAMIGMLTVDRAARRRGIARALKREMERSARLAGWHRLVTVNDGTNEGIRHLNEELGYRYLPQVFMLRGPIPPR